MKCTKCKTRITTHLWVVDDVVFCSPSCQRGKASDFDKTLRALAKMRRDSNN